jgi:nucleoid-associated protein YgaU
MPPAHRNIIVHHPRPHDIVHNPIHVAGYSTAFEGTVIVRVRDGNNKVIKKSFFTGGANGVYAAFRFNIGLQHEPVTRNGFLEVYEESAKDGSPIGMVRRPIVFGIALLHEYYGYRLYTVQSGDTLSKIAKDEYGDAGLWPVIHAANAHQVPDPDLIDIGEVLRLPQGLVP